MLIIKPQRMDAFAHASMGLFERRLMDHLRSAWPRECRLAGDDTALLRAVRRILLAAQANGYATARELTLYAKLVFSLGIGFDTDPQLEWAASALNNEAIDDLTARIDALYDQTADYLGAIGGEDSERVVRAMLRVRRYDFAASPTSTGEQLEEDLCDVLEAFWPEKAAFQETAPTLLMIRNSIEKAARYGITNPLGRCVFATMSYILGHDFDLDPLHPWAFGVLNDPGFDNGEARAEALLQVGLDRVAQTLTRD